MKHMTKRALAMLLVLVTVLTVFPVMTSTAVAEEPESVLDDTATAYDAWYVQNGLVMLLSAFDQEKAGITVADGLFASWNNKVKGGTDAAFYQTATVTWKFREGMGVGYDLTVAQVADSDLGKSLRLDLGTGIVDAYSNFTVEYFANVMRASENGAYVSGSAYNTNVNNEKFGPWGTWQFSMESSDDQSRCHYTANVLGDYGHNNAIQNFDPSGYILNLWNKVMVDGVATADFPKSVSSVILNPSATQSSRTYYLNGNLVKTFNRKSDALISGANAFFVMGGVGNTTYAVRVYNRDLTEAERLQNLFVDVAAYVGADISGLSAMTEEARALVFSASAGWAVNAVTREGVENTIKVLGTGLVMDKYDELYVQDGLEMLLTAFDDETSSADIYSGKWFNKKKDGFATLKGGIYAVSTNETGWKVGDKGISWTQDVTLSGTGAKSTGIYFTYDQLPAGDFTVQIASVNRGLTDNGQPYVEKYTTHYYFETAEPAGWRTTEQPAEGTYLTLTIDDVTYYYPGTTAGTTTWYWAKDTQKNAEGVDTEVWCKATALNDDGTVKTYYTTASGNGYGRYFGEQIAFGYFRNMGWINHAVYKYADGYPDGKVHYLSEGSDARAYRWYYTNQTYFQHNKNTSEAGVRDYLTADHSVMQSIDPDQPYTLTMLHQNWEIYATVGVYYGSQQVFMKDTTLAPYTPAENSLYQIMGVAGDYYAVRIYSKSLSEDEMAQNHFVDVAAYNGLDVTGVKELISSDPEAAQAMFDAMLAFHMRDSRVGAMQAVIDAAVKDITPGAAEMTVYDELYVEGMTALFTAFDAEKSGIDLAAGTWTDKLTGAKITLQDQSNYSQWHIGEGNRGVGYGFANLTQLTDGMTKIGMRLPTAVLNDGKLSIEYTFQITPVVNRDGTHTAVHRTDREGFTAKDGVYNVAAYDYSNGGQWGLYNGSNTSNFSFGGLQMCLFQLSDNPQGNSMRMRFFYSSKAWENTASVLTGQSGDKRSYIDKQVFGTSAYNTDVQTMTVNLGVEVRNGDGEYNRVDFDVLLDRVSKMKIHNDEGSNAQRKFYTVNDIDTDDVPAATAADAFFGLPSTVYAIRIYSDTLTDAEMKQNHAVDLMAYFELDVRGFAAADEAKKTVVYDAFASKTFEATEQEVAEMQAAIDAAVAGIPVAEGVQVGTDGSSLRIWASMDTAENVSKLGMTVVFKNGDEVVSSKSGETQVAFESITSGGNTVTADELRAEYLYAAIVKGIPAGTYTVEVTPYVILVDETVVTGETKSMDLTFN